MDWETPSFTEIDMSAEIGAYQSDFGDDPRRELPVDGIAPALRGGAMSGPPDCERDSD